MYSTPSIWSLLVWHGCLCFAVLFPGLADAESLPLKVTTFNIRLGTADDGENAWPLRRELLFEVIRRTDPDVLGLQEAMRMQLDELAVAFPQYARLGRGREADGGGEYSAILYRYGRLSVCNSGTFWLSDTPCEPGSKTWGNDYTRICTWANLCDRQARRRFSVYNTHWDHQSQPSRERSGQQIAKCVENCRDPVIVLGDFNVGEENPARKHFESVGFRDSFRDLYPDAVGVGTFNGFRGRTEGKKIDAVLVSPHWRTLEATIDRTEQEGRFPSDHFPVTATLQLH